MPLTVPSSSGSFQEVQGEDSTVLAITDAYPTVQDAIDYAETLSESATETGVTVSIPGGHYLEDVIIRKNVNLFGATVGGTRIQSITYRPSSNVAGPSSSRITALVADTLNVYAETAASSGVFWTEMFNELGLTLHDCGLGSVNIDRINTVTFQHCYATGSSAISITDSADVRFNHCYLLTLETSIDSTHSNLPVKIDIDLGPYALLYLTQSIVNGDLTLSRPAGDYPPILLSEGGFIYNLIANSDTQLNIRGGQVYSRTLNGTGHTIAEYSTYTPFNPINPADWDTAPITVDSALDELAARLRALEP